MTMKNKKTWKQVKKNGIKQIIMIKQKHWKKNRMRKNGTKQIIKLETET